MSQSSPLDEDESMNSVTPDNPISKPPPALPPGTASALSGISENFSFHASPESFITSRAIQFSQSHPDILDTRKVIRVKILNRNVAIVSSYAQIRQVLEGDNGTESTPKPNQRDQAPSFVAGSAYEALMAPFFPPPNLLLADGATHEMMRSSWNERMRRCHAGRWKEKVQSQINDYMNNDFLVKGSQGTAFDIYDAMKSFSWHALLGLFLDLSSKDPIFMEVQKMQETLLRGQFSLMPVSINAGFWKSPRKNGIIARENLQVLIAKILTNKGHDGPFGPIPEEQLTHVVNHVLMMTSSLAVKGLASLLTPLLLNIFMFRTKDGTYLSEKMRLISSAEERRQLLRSIYLETERLSPPIVGIMRRSNVENILPVVAGTEADLLIPQGWDTWLYFVGGGRDKETFGETSDKFDPHRYDREQVAEPLGFGLGPKACLGGNLVREIALNFAEACLVTNMNFQCINSLSPGVKGWLGWRVASPEEWASDMKQLPTQHPSRAVLVNLVREE